MDKDKLIKIAKELHQCAFDANAYFLIMQQYRKNRLDYFEEMKSSPAFYQIIYEALLKACFMEIAKLYDTSKDVVSIGILLEECKNNKALFLKYRDAITAENGEKTFTRYHHQPKPEEERFFKSEVETSRMLFAALDIPNAQNLPVQVDLTFSEILDLYKKRFEGLSKKRENIRVQRNKLYAHNDERCIMGDENPTDRYPISYPDIQELIEFALDFTGEILGILTGVSYANQYSNIDDWVGTLMLTRLGIKYKDYELKQREKSAVAEVEQLFGDKGSGKS